LQNLINDIKAPTTRDGRRKLLYFSKFKTRLGTMIAIADDHELFLLEFVEQSAVKRKLEQLKQKAKSEITITLSPVIQSIEKVLAWYFEGKLAKFKTPIAIRARRFVLALG